jgi:hypothetical protein
MTVVATTSSAVRCLAVSPCSSYCNNSTFCATDNDRCLHLFFSLLPIGQFFTLSDIFTAQLNSESQNNRKNQKDICPISANSRGACVWSERWNTTEASHLHLMRRGSKLPVFRDFRILELWIRDSGPIQSFGATCYLGMSLRWILIHSSCNFGYKDVYYTFFRLLCCFSLWTFLSV